MVKRLGKNKTLVKVSFEPSLDGMRGCSHNGGLDQRHEQLFTVELDDVLEGEEEKNSLPRNTSVKLFDMDTFMEQLKAGKTAVPDLLRLACLRMAFIRDTPDLNKTPCWIEVRMLNAFRVWGKCVVANSCC